MDAQSKYAHSTSAFHEDGMAQCWQKLPLQGHGRRSKQHRDTKDHQQHHEHALRNSYLLHAVG